MTELTRTISKAMSGILEELELENETYITLDRLEELVNNLNIKTNASMVASRLKKSGWLLPTDQRGVWEFAPAAVAGAYSKNDPLREIKAFQLANSDIICFLCLQTAAWALGYADRVPSRKELAFEMIPRRRMSKEILVYKYLPSIPLKEARGVKILAPESILVHIATKPDLIKSWDGVMEWLPDVIYDIDLNMLLKELHIRPDSVKKRTGYLLQGMYPDASMLIHEKIIVKSKVRFGARTNSIRNDEYWGVVDTCLPFSPKELERVK